MSISVVDQQLVDEVQSYLNALLSNSYIIKQNVLNQLAQSNPKMVDSFINAYCTDKGHHGENIPIYFNFPETPPKTAFLLAQYKGAQEDTDNAVLGGNEGPAVSSDTGETIHERLLVQVDDTKVTPIAYLETKYPVKDVVSIAQTNQFKVDTDNRIVLPFISLYQDEQVSMDVYYSKKIPNVTGYSQPIGINTTEGVTIDFISSNINTIRCLSAVFMYIEVYLRRTLEENGTIYLPSVEMNGMDMVEQANSETNSVNGQQLYYRRLAVTYHVTQTIDQGTKLLDEIHSELKGE